MLTIFNIFVGNAIAVSIGVFGAQTASPPAANANANANGPFLGMSLMPASELIRLAGLDVIDPSHYSSVAMDEFFDGQRAIFTIRSESIESADPNICQTDHIMFGARREGASAIVDASYIFTGFQWKPEAGCSFVDPNNDSKDGLPIDDFKQKSPRPVR